jgi:hypothetical protein
VPRVGKGKKGKKAKQGSGKGPVAKLPKKKCCESKTRCHRCPLRMLKEGTLPCGYTVHKRKLVTVEKAASIKAAKQAKKSGRAA